VGPDSPHQLRTQTIAPTAGERPAGALASAIGRVVSLFRARLGLYGTLQLAGWGAFVILNILALLPTLPAGILPRLTLTKLVRASWGFLASDALHRLYRQLDTPAFPRTLKPLVAGIAIFALGFAWTAAFFATGQLIAPPGTPGPTWSGLPHAAWDSTIVLGAWTAAYLGVRAWRQADASAREAEQARARADRAQLDALRYQLNPHFLFNALSSIRALISEDQAAARAMVTGFAEMLRNSLDAAAVSEVPLRDEIAAIRRYLQIERVRFEDSLDAAIEILPPAESWLVPTLLLHPLVENAVAHGERTDAEPLRIRIRGAASATGLRIEVANTGSLTSPDHSPAAVIPSPDRSIRDRRAVGVASVRERLALLYPGRHRFTLEQDGDWVRAIIEIDAAPAPPPA
jgi:two-component system, LytTR family, sensor kinase